MKVVKQQLNKKLELDIGKVVRKKDINFRFNDVINYVQAQKSQFLYPR